MECQLVNCLLPLDFSLIFCHTYSMTYTRSQLISALHSEYEFLCHDDFDPDVDMSPSEYLTHLQTMSLDDLINETSTDDTYTLDEFMDTHYG